MSISERVSTAKRDEDRSVVREQALCNEAIESGEYDSISDEDWILLCERIAAETRAKRADRE
jgi:hypothetical protein